MSPFFTPFAAIAYPFYWVGTALSVKKTDERFLLKNNGIFALKIEKGW
jgi:hypothetical protein